ncbi:MAG: SDR family oxidoreductase [Anaerolineae bacterium]|nr:SDR family oxidoreductase [Anaerolineae bacterium]
MGKFADKGVLVTGAGVGIGYEICREFAAEGAFVALNDIDGALAAQSAGQINAEVGREAVYSYGFDVADVAAIRAMFADFERKAGRIDVAVANAGLTNFGEFLTYTPEAFDRLTSVNLRGSYFTAQAAAQHMIAKNIPGRIILMSSITGGQVFLNLGAYGVTKAGIRQMAKVLGVELGKYGITVNAISPGLTITERTVKDDPGADANWATVTPTGRTGRPADIAAAALFLASPEARHITGQTLEVDGGWTATSPMPAAHPAKPEFSSQLR